MTSPIPADLCDPKTAPEGPGLAGRLLTCLCIIATVAINVTVPRVEAATWFVDAAAEKPGSGSGEQPFPTIQQGVDHAIPGDTVIVRRGIYREEIRVNQGGTAEAPITLQANPIGSAIVDGADPVGGFTEANAPGGPENGAKIWMTSSYTSPYMPMDNAFNLREDWLKEGPVGAQQVELLSRNDMVWLDGRFLRQVDAPEDLGIGTFWVDRQHRDRLSLALPAGDRPENHLVEAAKRGVLLEPGDRKVSFVHVRGFHFTRGASGNGKALANFGTYYSTGWVAEDNIADWGSWGGINAFGSHNRLLRNVAADNGDQGIGAVGLSDSLLDGNTSVRNNWKGIRDTYHCGGGKFVESRRVVIRNHEAAFNRGPGLWFDIDNRDVTIERSRFHDNKYAGIYIEIAPGPVTIRANTCWANAGSGIVIAESNLVRVEDNVSAANWFGIELRNVQGRHGHFGSDDKSEKNRKDTPWQLSGVVLRNNILINNARAGIGETCAYLDPASGKIDSDKNIFWDNPPLWWCAAASEKKIKTPAGVIGPVFGEWIFTSMEAMEKFGIDAHSEWRDPKIMGSAMYSFPYPVAAPEHPAPQ